MAKKENNQPGKFLKKRKKRFPVLAVILLLVAVLAAGWWILGQTQDPAGETETTSTSIETAAPGDTGNPESPQNTDAPETSQPTSATRPSGEYDLPQAYQDVLNRYAQAVSEKWDIIQCEENQISYMVMFLSDLRPLGYHTPDLDHDGIRELIISDGNVIYDLYTLKGNELVWVLSGHERNSYQLCMDGFILNHGSNGAASFVDTIYYLKNGNLTVKQSIMFEGMNQEPKWELSGEGIETPEPINENRYREIISSYQKVAIPLIPFSDMP